MREPLEPSGAVAEMLAKDGTLDDLLSGRGLRFDQTPAAPPAQPPGPPLQIEPPDWDQELAERAAIERAEAEREATARNQQFLDKLEGQSLEPRPAPKSRRKIFGWPS